MTRWLAVYAVLAYAFLHVPLVVLAAFSFNASRYTVWQGFSLGWYRGAFSDAQLREGAWNSLVIALLATVISTAIGPRAPMHCGSAGPVAVGRSVSLAGHARDRHRDLVARLFQWVFRYVHLRLGMYTVILAHVAFSIAYVVIVVIARLRTFDPALEEAALDLGATEWQTFWRVTLPCMAPGIVAAALLAFTVSFDDYVITSMVAGVDSETLPMVIYAMARRGANPVVNAISSMIVFGSAPHSAVGESAPGMKRRTFLMGAAWRQVAGGPSDRASTSSTGPTTSRLTRSRTSSANSASTCATRSTRALKRCSRRS